MQNYYTVWRLFNKFFVKLDYKPDNWEDTLTLFIGFLIDQKKKASTINSYVSAIKKVLHQHKIKMKEDRSLLSAIIRASKIKNDIVMTRLPIQKPLIKVIWVKLQEIFDQQQYLLILYRAIFCITYFGLLRIGQVTKSPHVILARDVTIGTNKEKIRLLLRSSKTHRKHQKPQVIKFKKERSSNRRKSQTVLICPYRALKAYTDIRPTCKSKNEQLCIFGDRSPVKAQQLRAVLKQCIVKNGMNPKYHVFHGIRGGAHLTCSSWGSV